MLLSSIDYFYCWFLSGYSSVQVAVDNNDPEMCDFVEGEYLEEQVLLSRFGYCLNLHFVFSELIINKFMRDTASNYPGSIMLV